ncbi:hypothetical protein EIN_299430 [Entamoeba invadens IP1]|uniref:small monomeric GTPase n=1 Tax=Entamoeba invadens IP1 TaxID=370355 RepID=A0A0A1UCC7_ENTIV|nr:hypothetical protein EIN_299430 [Entamoeba invadens IP1]ELP89934.1 hypothetical protein EIN_299430 [Entamoeba invadens IP1]|eukprot:XP_004256705.1 hypothetical protein EIN_299430 [Entamoeba invadens IP1]
MPKTIKLVILGSGAVGKSAITIQLVSGQFIEIYDPTIEDTYKASIPFNGEIIPLDILDTAGQEEYSALRDRYMKSGDGYVIVYSITSTSSFLDAKIIREQLIRVLDNDNASHLSILLCGNKCDLENERQVSLKQGNDLAHEWKVLFFETSAKNKINIIEAFQELVNDVKLHKLDDEENNDRDVEFNNANKSEQFILSKKCTVL